MRIDYFQAQNVRNLTKIELEPGPHLNLFIGQNASGKTALLEAVYILSRGRSFRTPRMAEVIQHHKNSLVVAADISQSPARSFRTGIEKLPGKTIIRFDGEIINKISDQAKNLPLILIAPDTHRLITGEPKLRRHWLDWGMFHVEPDYLTQWKEYHRALRQRNTLLKSSGVDNALLEGWEVVMSDTGTRISRLRRNFINKLQKVTEGLSINREMESPDFKYLQGWSEDQELKECLANERRIDRQFGFTRSGIHRADIEFIINNHSLSSVFSRGRIKQFITTLLLAQSVVLQDMTGRKPIVLIDDYSAEIDATTRSRLFSMLSERGMQAFLTSTESNPELTDKKEVVLFHVEHGKLRKVVK